MARDESRIGDVRPQRAGREEALRELDAVLAEIGHERLIAWAEANRPPRSWSDEDLDGLLGDGDPP